MDQEEVWCEQGTKHHCARGLHAETLGKLAHLLEFVE